MKKTVKMSALGERGSGKTMLLKLHRKLLEDLGFEPGPIQSGSTEVEFFKVELDERDREVLSHRVRKD